VKNLLQYDFLSGLIVSFADACLCLSSLPSFVSSNPVAIAGAKLVGSGEVTVIIDNLVGSSSL
jgi:hypothetical protein